MLKTITPTIIVHGGAGIYAVLTHDNVSKEMVTAGNVRNVLN